MVERFTKINDMDHWVHSINYANIAAMVVEELGLHEVVSGPATVGRVKVGGMAPSVIESARNPRVGW
jgi:hypothetical protein